MRRLLLSLATGLAFTGAAIAQQSSVYSTAVPPDRAALDRLNLRNEWTAQLPLDGRHDAVGPVQIVDGEQIFVQTRSGLLLALDANTGAAKWNYRFPAGYVSMYPVAVSEHFVFAINVARLYCFHRYTGVVEFDYELPGTPSAGPLVDHELVYLILNSTRVMAYRFPTVFRVADRKRDAKTGEKPLQNPADALAARYAVGRGNSVLRDVPIDRPQAPPTTEPTSGLAVNQRTPSVSALPSISPPYTISNRGLYATPSLNVLPTLRQPYQYKPDHLQFNQLSPSIAVLPPSVARVHELANFRPKGVEPIVEWVYAADRRLSFDPLRVLAVRGDGSTAGLLVNRLWMTTESPHLLSLSAANGRVQVGGQLQDAPSASMSPPLPFTRPDSKPTDPDARTVLGVVPLRDGNVIAVDLLGGNPEGPKIEWRANVGGLLNRQPVATPDGVFVGGHNSGIAKIDTATGEVNWRSEQTVDRVLAVNQEFVYAQDRVGNLLIFDRRGPSNTATTRANALAKLPLTGFNVPITNHTTDRMFLAADSGTLVCLRDAAAKYTRPMAVVPPPAAPAKKEEKKDEEKK